MTLPVLRTLTLHREGRVFARVVPGSHHIGHPGVVDTMGNTVAVRYTVNITVHPNDLDEHGFIVDQEALHTVIDDMAGDPVPWTNPGEVLVDMWGRRILQWISVTNLNCQVRSMDLTLSPAPHLGGFTAQYSLS